jgi:hypothetical protein
MQVTNVSVSYSASATSKILIKKSLEEDSKEGLDILLAEYVKSPDCSTFCLPDWITIRLKWANRK